MIDSSFNPSARRIRREGIFPLLALLTPAEQAVTEQLRVGLTNKEIAAVLGKSPATVKAQVGSILHKLRMPTRCRLLVWLHEQQAERGQA